MDLIPDPVLTKIDSNLDPEKSILRIKENKFPDKANKAKRREEGEGI